MGETTIPDTPAGIDAEWLNDALDGWPEIASVDHEDIGLGTGIFGQLSRLHLAFADGNGASHPDTLVVKMACLEPENLTVANALGIYERELRFYDELTDSLPFRVPERHVAVRAEDGRFVLVMEDLGRAMVVGDQVEGATVEQAERIVDRLVPFHVAWWEHPNLASFDWLPVPNAPAYVAAVPGIYRAGLPVLEAEWADRISAKAMETARAVDPKFEELLERTAAGPTTIIHTDTRLDNFFFAPDGSDEVALIDFQLALRGRGVADVAYLVGTSMPQDLAREHWEPLLRRWHAGINAGDLSYSWDDCLTHYKEAALYYLSGAMSLIGTFDAGNDRGAAMAEAYSTRILEHVADIDAASVL